VLRYEDIDPVDVDVLLCDADGNLFPSEEPAFVASAEVTNQFLRDAGVERQFTPTELRLATTGKNFRTTIVDLAVTWRVPIAPDLTPGYAGPTDVGTAVAGRRGVLSSDELERWVAEEKRVVTAYLRHALMPDPEVLAPLTALSRQFGLAAVSSSALSRLAACFDATGLSPLFPPDQRFSAEDSLPTPTSKPDPAIYTFAGQRLGISPSRALAIEDSVPGAQSAVAAGYRTIGNVQFVPHAERSQRMAALEAVGVVAMISSWSDLCDVLLGT
jgi:beta-phosphoglucomutase-like phosphatase (HAD superfamily)